jgi:peptide/nickel transport system permease protein
MDELQAIPPTTIARPPTGGFGAEAWRHFRRRKLAMIALAFVVCLCLFALFAPLIVGTKPIVCQYKGRIYFPCLGYYVRSWENPIFYKDRLLHRYPSRLAELDADSWAIWPLVYQDPYWRVRENEWPGRPGNPWGVHGAPSQLNWLGTNQQGVDVFAQMVHGTQIALSVGFVSMGIAATIGITLGALAGYLGGWVDMLLSRLIELVMCVPSLVLILALVAILDNVTNYHLMAIIGATHWTSIARLTRAEFLKLKQLEFVTAARAMGASRPRIMFRPGAGAHHVRHRGRNPDRKRPQLPGLRRLAAQSELGDAAQIGPHRHRANVVADPVPRPGDLLDRPFVQPDRRSAPRSHRPPPPTIRSLIKK